MPRRKVLTRFAQLAGGARARASAAVTVRLSTEATNGCYGVLVIAVRTALPAGEHAVERHGLRQVASGARMFQARVESESKILVPGRTPLMLARRPGARTSGRSLLKRPRQRLPGYRTDRARLSLRLRPGHPRSAGRSARRRRTTRPRPRRAVPGRTAHRGTRQGTPGRPGAPCR
jgi:hypothetical protein